MDETLTGQQAPVLEEAYPGCMAQDMCAVASILDPRKYTGPVASHLEAFSVFLSLPL